MGFRGTVRRQTEQDAPSYWSSSRITVGVNNQALLIPAADQRIRVFAVYLDLSASMQAGAFATAITVALAVFPSMGTGLAQTTLALSAPATDHDSGAQSALVFNDPAGGIAAAGAGRSLLANLAVTDLFWGAPPAQLRADSLVTIRYVLEEA